MISKMLWYMIQPVLCFIHIHDWIKEASMTRKCEYCGRIEVFKGIGENKCPVWEKKNII